MRRPVGSADRRTNADRFAPVFLNDCEHDQQDAGPFAHEAVSLGLPGGSADLRSIANINTGPAFGTRLNRTEEFTREIG